MLILTVCAGTPLAAECSTVCSCARLYDRREGRIWGMRAVSSAMMARMSMRADSSALVLLASYAGSAEVVEQYSRLHDCEITRLTIDDIAVGKHSARPLTITSGTARLT